MMRMRKAKWNERGVELPSFPPCLSMEHLFWTEINTIWQTPLLDFTLAFALHITSDQITSQAFWLRSTLDQALDYIGLWIGTE